MSAEDQERAYYRITIHIYIRCDRVLYKANVGNYDLYPLSLEPGTYSSLNTFTQSDHKPVTASFKM